jgi:hypothetical protein
MVSLESKIGLDFPILAQYFSEKKDPLPGKVVGRNGDRC